MSLIHGDCTHSVQLILQALSWTFIRTRGQTKKSKMISESIDKKIINNKGLFVSTDAGILFM
jgi:hypothetical protein